MKIRFIILLALISSNAGFVAAEEIRIFQMSPDEFFWRLIIEKNTYTLLTVPMSGAICSESGIVENNKEELRFVSQEDQDCKHSCILGESWFMIVERNGEENLVEEDRIVGLEEALSCEMQLWFAYFKRREDIEAAMQRGEIG